MRTIPDLPLKFVNRQEFSVNTITTALVFVYAYNFVPVDEVRIDVISKKHGKLHGWISMEGGSVAFHGFSYFEKKGMVLAMQLINGFKVGIEKRWYGVVIAGFNNRARSHDMAAPAAMMFTGGTSDWSETDWNNNYAAE